MWMSYPLRCVQAHECVYKNQTNGYDLINIWSECECVCHMQTTTHSACVCLFGLSDSTTALSQCSLRVWCLIVVILAERGKVSTSTTTNEVVNHSRTCAFSFQSTRVWLSICSIYHYAVVQWMGKGNEGNSSMNRWQLTDFSCVNSVLDLMEEFYAKRA